MTLGMMVLAAWMLASILRPTEAPPETRPVPEAMQELAQNPDV